MRKAFNFYNSYWKTAIELNDKERLSFYDALIHYQFTGDESKFNKLVGMAKFAYISQKHSIEQQMKGYLDIGKRWNNNKLDTPTIGGTIGATIAPTVQEQEQEQVQVQEQEQSFVIFWDLYNKKQGDKLACEKKWSKLKDVEREKIFATLPNFLKNIKDKKFQPLPATYLNQKRWNDEMPEIKQTTITQASNNEW